MYNYALVIGLGNPGIKYKNNRHNIGFNVLDMIVKRFDLKIFKKKIII